MPLSLAIRAALWIWLIGALAVGQYHWLARAPAQAVPAVILALTGLLVLAYRAFGGFRAWIEAIDLRALVLFHLTRLAGFYYLVLYHRGDLSYAFAVPAGFGDILVAVLAVIVAFVPFSAENRPRFTYLWNVVGFIDLLLVFATATRLSFNRDNYDFFALTHLPLSLFPTFLVPLLLGSHLAIFARLKRLES